MKGRNTVSKQNSEYSIKLCTASSGYVQLLLCQHVCTLRVGKREECGREWGSMGGDTCKSCMYM